MSDINFNQRLNRLEERRKGSNFSYSFDGLNEDTVLKRELDTLKESMESWQSASDKPSVRYALGAMQEVGKRYTEISVETAVRVQKQLKSRLLDNHGINTEYRLQGSVPLNVHIKGISDVDLLVIDESHYRSEHYLETLRSQDIIEISKLRAACHTQLKSAYPAVTVDNTGAKCIKLVGGSLQREVDVVPSHWVRTDKYQQEKKAYDLGVNILDSKTPTTLMNLPFRHIYLIDTRCRYLTEGGLKKSIRLCKTLKADLITEGSKIHLSSFDIASIMYHANLDNLKKGSHYPLAVVLETQRFFDYLYNNSFRRDLLFTPDNSRLIFDTEDKKSSLTTMSLALDNLVKEIKKDLGYSYNSSLESHYLTS
ncbi:hypothetical protein [Psychrobacter sp. Pi2-1]|uniref:hypothetical protein n=1 Tax=Psychrobacter sp. Pi2-1 TaxID=2774131 RepID=UPI00191A6225|nr:hypothetical protein [Psychrobacter sp. Pi2-1]